MVATSTPPAGLCVSDDGGGCQKAAVNVLGSGRQALRCMALVSRVRSIWYFRRVCEREGEEGEIGIGKHFTFASAASRSTGAVVRTVGFPEEVGPACVIS